MDDTWPYHTVLITGGTGTFGTALTAYLRAHEPSVFVRIFSRDEQKQAVLRARFGEDHMSYLLGDVRDLARLRLACRGVDLVVHAAALKVVPAGQYNPMEFHATNVLGSLHVMQAALDGGVPQTIFLSSDKAVAPLNVYGKTKALAEDLVIQWNACSYAQGPRFSCVRYGNVAGSRGSVLETFQRRLTAGEPLTLTHPAMTRFWMTAEEAVALVCYAAIHADRGELWVPVLPAFRMADLVRAFYDVYGRDRPETIPTTGVRPGEKLHEWLLTAEEVGRCVAVAASAASYYVIAPATPSWGEGLPLDERFGPALTAAPQVPPYCSDVWPWRLSVAELVDRLEVLRMNSEVLA